MSMPVSKGQNKISLFHVQIAERIGVEHVREAWCKGKICRETREHMPGITIQQGRSQVDAECSRERSQQCSVCSGEKIIYFAGGCWSIDKADALYSVQCEARMTHQHHIPKRL